MTRGKKTTLTPYTRGHICEPPGFYALKLTKLSLLYKGLPNSPKMQPTHLRNPITDNLRASCALEKKLQKATFYISPVAGNKRDFGSQIHLIGTTTHILICVSNAQIFQLKDSSHGCCLCSSTKIQTLLPRTEFVACLHDQIWSQAYNSTRHLTSSTR